MARVMVSPPAVQHPRNAPGCLFMKDPSFGTDVGEAQSIIQHLAKVLGRIDSPSLSRGSGTGMSGVLG